MMLKLVPRQTSALRGECSTRESEAKKHGRRLPYVCISLRRRRIPCSGRTFPVPHFCYVVSLRLCDVLVSGSRTGPPMAPSRTASAFFAALRASSVKGSPCASIEAWLYLSKCSFPVCLVTYSSEQMILEVEFDVLALFLYNLEDLLGNVSWCSDCCMCRPSAP